MTRLSGFSLFELMVTLAIVGILMAAAYPSYAAYVVRARRAEGQVALIEAMQQEERYYTRHNRYIAFSAGADDADARLFRWYSGPSPAKSAYALRAEACSGVSLADCVIISAVPGGRGVDPAFRDADCGTLTLRSTGERMATGPADGCWR